MTKAEEVIAHLENEAKAWVAQGGMGTRNNVGDIAGFVLKTSRLGTEEAIKRSMAGDDPEAHALLCGRAGFLLSKGEALPPDLRAYAASTLLALFVSSIGKRSKGRPTDWLRNAFIAVALGKLRDVGITPTLNPATKDANPELRSGCRIVAETLNGVGVNIEESGVAEVWRDHGEEILAAVGSLRSAG